MLHINLESGSFVLVSLQNDTGSKKKWMIILELKESAKI